MQFGISHLSVVPVRQEPADFHEQVNQILFGEWFEVLETNEKWVFIKTYHDGYQGWIDRKQFTLIDSSVYESLAHSSRGVVRNALANITSSVGITSYLSMGSLLPSLNHGHFDLGGVKYSFKGEIIQKPIFNPDLLLDSIHLFLNAPYQWGGRSILGIDCSGFTQVLYRLMGINLPRDASQQIEIGTPIAFIEESKFGDLAFFGLEEKQITHVGILMGLNRVAHASGKVRIDWVDHEGIFNRELGVYTHHLRTIRRISI